MKLIYESDNGVMLKTESSSDTYYLIKSATINKSFWNTGLSYANVFAKKESALKKLYTITANLYKYTRFIQDFNKILYKTGY